MLFQLFFLTVGLCINNYIDGAPYGMVWGFGNGRARPNGPARYSTIFLETVNTWFFKVLLHSFHVLFKKLGFRICLSFSRNWFLFVLAFVWVYLFMHENDDDNEFTCNYKPEEYIVMMMLARTRIQIWENESFNINKHICLIIFITWTKGFQQIGAIILGATVFFSSLTLLRCENRFIMICRSVSLNQKLISINEVNSLFFVPLISNSMSEKWSSGGASRTYKWMMNL